MKTEEIR